MPLEVLRKMFKRLSNKVFKIRKVFSKISSTTFGRFFLLKIMLPYRAGANCSSSRCYARTGPGPTARLPDAMQRFSECCRKKRWWKPFESHVEILALKPFERRLKVSFQVLLVDFAKLLKGFSNPSKVFPIHPLRLWQ